MRPREPGAKRLRSDWASGAISRRTPGARRLQSRWASGSMERGPPGATDRLTTNQTTNQTTTQAGSWKLGRAVGVSSFSGPDLEEREQPEGTICEKCRRKEPWCQGSWWSSRWAGSPALRRRIPSPQTADPQSPDGRSPALRRRIPAPSPLPACILPPTPGSSSGLGKGWNGWPSGSCPVPWRPRTVAARRGLRGKRRPAGVGEDWTPLPARQWPSAGDRSGPVGVLVPEAGARPDPTS